MEHMINKQIKNENTKLHRHWAQGATIKTIVKFVATKK